MKYYTKLLKNISNHHQVKNIALCMFIFQGQILTIEFNVIMETAV